MPLRVPVLVAILVGAAATPLAAAQAPDAQAAGLRRPDGPSKPADAPRRYSLHREFGETPDPAPLVQPQAAAVDAGLVLAPDFFDPAPPNPATPPADAPARDRQGRPIQPSAPDDAPQV